MTIVSVTAVDTSVAIPLLVASHRQHVVVAQWATGRVLALSGHAPLKRIRYSLLPVTRVASAGAVTLIDKNFAECCPLGVRAARAAHREFARRGIAGGATYDGLVAVAARECALCCSPGTLVHAGL